jgi:hypothetical protein
MIQIPGERRVTNDSDLHWHNVCEADDIVDRGHTHSTLLNPLKTEFLLKSI